MQQSDDPGSEEVTWQENVFPEKIERTNRKFLLFAPPIAFVVLFTVSVLIQMVVPHPLFPFLDLSLASIGALILFFGPYTGSRKLIERIGLTENGFYVVDRAKRKWFIGWTDIFSIEKSYNEIYVLHYYKKGEGVAFAPLALMGYIALDLKDQWEDQLKVLEETTIKELKENEKRKAHISELA
ncbi:MAG: hypothetical protein JSW00_14540 [Thermoplasmata archaeon]|nr:MAG: hypothetical protein JSW00_14540 [Thermoplasmata archaeon]